MFIYIAKLSHGKNFNNVCLDESFYSILGKKTFFDFMRNLALGQKFGLYFIIRNVFQDPLETLSLNFQIIGMWVA